MIISDTNYSVKVESDISSYKDLLLGAFFFQLEQRLMLYIFLYNIHIILAIFIAVMLIKSFRSCLYYNNKENQTKVQL